MQEPKRYLANPDVSCREERPGEGALLFNPDTDGSMAINPVGLILWHTLARPSTQDDLVARLVEACEGVPAGQVGTDVDEFLSALLPGGFVGVLLEDDR